MSVALVVASIVASHLSCASECYKYILLPCRPNSSSHNTNCIMSPSQFIILPSLPAAHDAFIPYLASRPEAPIRTLVEPYNKYDAELRSIFAQQPSHPAISETHIVPVFDGHEENENQLGAPLSISPSSPAVSTPAGPPPATTMRFACGI